MIRCLLIDDNKFHRKVVSEAVAHSQLEIEIQEASDIRSAERLLDADRPDCILLDQQLPDENGLAFAKRYLASGADTAAVIMLTGEGNETIARDALQIGILDYLPKGNLSQASLEAVITNAMTKARLQQERQAALDELKRSNDALSRFASIVAHDLKAPIRQIMTYAGFLAEDYRSVLDRDGHKLLGTIERSSERALTLVDSILAYSRLDKTGEAPLELSLETAVDDAIANLRGPIDEAQASVEIGELTCVVGIRSQLMQLFQNLISNALKFRHAARAPVIRIELRASDDATVEIAVRDNGIGIAEDDRNRIFDMLERLHSQDRYEGSGVGLAICRRIAENHGGRIWCESEDGAGSTFVVKLARGEPQAETESARRETRPARRAAG